ncbi:MAG: cytochrome c oxidase subunit 3, partial [Sphingomonadaceae bacterium]|nr:cytochrome c oxidase subunit 3 [Sphingomonadaceae bacterium]
MAGATNHDYHILPPDIWPLIGSFSALTFTSGMVLFMHEMANAHLVLGLGIAGLIATFFSWWSNVVKEAETGHHTPVVQLHMRYGMILFIASEVMFFVGWFWAFFDFALFPNALSEVSGGVFPSVAVEAVMNPFSLPLLNTLILLCSGTTVTWAHHSLIHGDREGLKKGLWLTIMLGILFSAIQAYEYAHA